MLFLSFASVCHPSYKDFLSTTATSGSSYAGCASAPPTHLMTDGYDGVTAGPTEGSVCISCLSEPPSHHYLYYSHTDRGPEDEAESLLCGEVQRMLWMLVYYYYHKNH